MSHYSEQYLAEIERHELEIKTFKEVRGKHRAITTVCGMMDLELSKLRPNMVAVDNMLDQIRCILGD